MFKFPFKWLQKESDVDISYDELLKWLGYQGFEIESLHKFMQDKVEALEFIIKDNIDGITNIPLKDLKLKSGILIACIVHRDKVIIPGGNDIISTGDTVIVIATKGQMQDLKDILK